MPICPSCKADVKRKGGACPLCGTELLIHQGQYYRAEIGSPAQAILNAFEEWVSRQSSKAQNMPIVFHISKKTPQYRRELVEAERLLAICDGDLDLVLLTLTVLFENKQFSFKTRSSLVGLNNKDFPLAQAIAKAIHTKQLDAADKAGQAFELVLNKEDIFA
jgi:hypothetical protein